MAETKDHIFLFRTDDSLDGMTDHSHYVFLCLSLGWNETGAYQGFVRASLGEGARKVCQALLPYVW